MQLHFYLLFVLCVGSCTGKMLLVKTEESETGDTDTVNTETEDTYTVNTKTEPGMDYKVTNFMSNTT